MYNLKRSDSIEDCYQQGLLPQRNDQSSFYFDSSCRSNLDSFVLSSENRRILKKTANFSYQVNPLKGLFNLDLQKQIFSWIKTLGWDFPISSVKTIFTNHIFNTLYTWQDNNQKIVAYSICYFSPKISHIAYVFYDPQYAKSNLPIRLTLQVIIDSFDQKLNYCYLGRFDPDKNIGYYKRTLPGFEYFKNQSWSKYTS